MSPHVFAYIFLILLARIEAIEETSTVTIPATNSQDNQPAPEKGPAASLQDPLSTDFLDELLKEIAPAMSQNKHSVDHARQSQDSRPFDSADSQVQVAAPADREESESHLGSDNPSADLLTPGKSPHRAKAHFAKLKREPTEETENGNTPDSKQTNAKLAQNNSPARSGRSQTNTKDNPLHSVDHARQPQDNRPLYSADKQVQVAAPADPEESAAHKATENPSDVYTPSKSGSGKTIRQVVKREQTNSTSNDPVKNIRDLSGDEFASDPDNNETSKSKKRDTQNVANILISTSKHVHSNRDQQQQQQPTPQNSGEQPKCPTLAEFINATEGLWNGLKTSDGTEGGLFSLFSAMSESVVILAQCGLKLLNELGVFLGQSNSNSGQQDASTYTNANPVNQGISFDTVTEDPFDGDDDPLFTRAPLVDLDEMPTEKNNPANLNVDFSMIPKTNKKPDTGFPGNIILGNGRSDNVIVKTNVSKTEVLGNNRGNGYFNQPQSPVLETNVTQTDLVDFSQQNPRVLQSNFTKTEVVDKNPSKPGNMPTNDQPVDTEIMESSPPNLVTTKTPNIFTVNVFSLNKDQRNFPSPQNHDDKVKTDKADNLGDYDYGDYSIEKANMPENSYKKKRDGKGNRRWRKRTVKSVESIQKRP